MLDMSSRPLVKVQDHGNSSHYRSGVPWYMYRCEGVSNEFLRAK
jgi:hypothetical protein